MIIVGIDPSINSTGVCVRKNNKIIYYNIVGKVTKKMKEFNHPNIYIIEYTKSPTKDLDYIGKEQSKTNNIYNICIEIGNILDIYKPSKVIMEGVAYSSNGSVIDLAGLNYAIRMICRSRNIPIEIISPTTVKKFAVANGQAEKDIMINAWKRLDSNISDINNIKIDDLADAYFLAHYEP